MKEPRSSLLMEPIPLLRCDNIGPRYAQITRALRQAIRCGDYLPGARLPASRELAQNLGCARNLVLMAYEQLALEGYVDGRAGGGTVVSPAIGRARTQRVDAHTPHAVQLSGPGELLQRFGRAAASLATPAPQAQIDFAYAPIGLDERGRRRLKWALGRAAAGATASYPDPAGDQELRTLIAERLRRTRGIRCTAAHIIITTGSQQGLDLCARLFVAHGQRVAVEDPTYQGATAVFEAAGARISRVPVDAHGIVTEALPRRGRTALVHVTPSHQFPSGAVMTAARRHALLKWAARSGALVLEDDYDSELRHDRRPLEALAALDQRGVVVYCGTFARTLTPALRLGYLVVPEALVDAVVASKWLTDRGGSPIVQLAVSLLMSSGEYDRAIRRMTKAYRVRRDALVAALSRGFGEHAIVQGGDAGCHLVVSFPQLKPHLAARLIADARARGVGVYPLAAYACRQAPMVQLLLGYGTVSVAAIETGVLRVASAYRMLIANPPIASVQQRSWHA